MKFVLSFCETLVHEAASDTIYRATSQQVRQKREQKSDEYYFERIDPPEDDELKQGVEDHRQSEYFDDCVPTFTEHRAAVRGVSKDGIEVRRSSRFGIFQTVANRKDRRHRRLH